MAERLIDCIICGEQVVAKTAKRQYCSHKCGREGRARGIKTAAQFKTATCIGCGDEFSRPIGYTSAMRYCSNECAHRETKKVRDKYVVDLPDAAVVFKSMYEVRFVAACERFGIPWRRYDGEAIETPSGNYRPDFIVHDEIVVEIKGHLGHESLVKTTSAKELLGDKYVLLMKSDLEEFEREGLGKLTKV